MKAGLLIIFSIFTIIGILAGVELETVILPDGNLLVKSPGWIFRLTVGVLIGLIPLLVYAIVMRLLPYWKKFFSLTELVIESAPILFQFDSFTYLKGDSNESRPK